MLPGLIGVLVVAGIPHGTGAGTEPAGALVTVCAMMIGHMVAIKNKRKSLAR